MAISQYIYTGLAIVFMAIALLSAIGLFLYSLVIFWCMLNSDVIERNRRIRKLQEQWKEENDFEEP